MIGNHKCFCILKMLFLLFMIMWKDKEGALATQGKHRNTSVRLFVSIGDKSMSIPPAGNITKRGLEDARKDRHATRAEKMAFCSPIWWNLYKCSYCMNTSQKALGSHMLWFILIIRQRFFNWAYRLRNFDKLWSQKKTIILFKDSLVGVSLNFWSKVWLQEEKLTCIACIKM